MIIATHSEIAMMLLLFDILSCFVKILMVKIFFWYLLTKRCAYGT